MKSIRKTPNVYIPKFQDIVFYPYSPIDNAPLICDSDNCKYICIFVDYFPSAYPSVMEPSYMRDLVEYAQSNHVDRFVISATHQDSISLLIKDYIEAVRPKN